MQCQGCDKAVTGLVCEACGAIAPPRLVDKFAALGVPRAYALDRELLDARYRDLSRRLHPDRFARATARERMLSLQAATSLNEAYRTLKDPVQRAEYLLELSGVKIGDNEPVDPELLEEMLDLRESGAEAAGVAARRDAVWQAVERGFAAGAPLGEIKKGLVELRYLSRFLEEREGKDEH